MTLINSVAEDNWLWIFWEKSGLQTQTPQISPLVSFGPCISLYAAEAKQSSLAKEGLVGQKVLVHFGFDLLASSYVDGSFSTFHLKSHLCVPKVLKFPKFQETPSLR